MGCGVSKQKSVVNDTDVLHSQAFEPDSVDENQTRKIQTSVASNKETTRNMYNRKVSEERTKIADDGDSAKRINIWDDGDFKTGTSSKDGTSTETSILRQKITSFLNITEEATTEALALAGKHPDIQEQFIHLVNIMHDVVKKNCVEFVKQLHHVTEFDEPTMPEAGKDMIHFLAVIGGAQATFEVYAEQLRSMNITHLTDKLLKDAIMHRNHENTLFVILMMRDFWESATDCCLEFAGQLAETSLISCLAEDLINLDKNFPATSNVFESSMTLLHNCAHSRQCKHRFRDIGAVQLLASFLAREEKEIKMLSLLTLSYIIDEEDSHLLFANASDFDFLLVAVASAWKSKNHRDLNGYTLEELLQGLGNLAQNDDNKTLLMQKDVVTLLKPVLETGSDAEKQEAAQIMWNLAFNKDNRSKMKKDAELVACLEKLRHSSYKGVAKASNGVLWVLNMDKKINDRGNRIQEDINHVSSSAVPPRVLPPHAPIGQAHSPPPPPPPPCAPKGQAHSPSPPPPPPPPCAPKGQAHSPSPPPPVSLAAPLTPLQPTPSSADGQGKGHIMISYQWASQKLLLQIRNSLRNKGYSVWMDVDNMSGSTLQAMAEAVEKAVAVLICMSQRYKDSLNCRTEAEYAFELHKPIIPLLVERDYRPDGWLGIIKGSKLFFDFSGKYPYEKKVEELMKELGHRGCIDSSQVDGPIRGESVHPLASAAVSTNVVSWSEEDVCNWLKKNQLSGCPKLKGLTRENLKFLQKLSQRAPEFFFLYLKQDLKLTSLSDLMHFSDAIDKLL